MNLEFKKYMKIALAEAVKGRNAVYPNPMVGCVVVKDTTIVAKGWHERFGGPHAEVNALKTAGAKARGADLYVTLEPCAHWGKTPPCTNAITDSGVRRVIYAMSDPNPATSCQCHSSFNKAGITYIGGVLQHEAQQLNKEYCKLFTKKHKSQVLVKAAMSLDGKIALASGDSRWITGEKARKIVHSMRAKVDGIMVGVNTVLMDNPNLTSHGVGRNPVRLIIDPDLRSPVNSNVFNSEAGTIVFFRTNKFGEKRRALKKKGVVMIQLGLLENIKHVVNILSKMHIYKILIEGGGETSGRAFDAGIVDEVAFFVAPKILGGRDSISPVEGTGIDRLANAVNLGPLTVQRYGKDLLIKARVVK
jgi:diaminohydroxyphosphoribosylaminopyrimidine deaminase/5-amino-6-(5-phosphoribosylamino)uracil reductase